MIYPGKVGYSYTDASRDLFDKKNAEIIRTGKFPHTVFFGDSLTWYMPLKKSQVTFRFVNRGIPGDCAYYMPHRFAADVLQLQPKRVVLMCGVNDVINCAIGVRPYIGQTLITCVNTIFQAIIDMVNQAREQGIEVVLASVLPIKTPMGHDIDNDVANQMIEFLNEQIADLAQARQLTFIDYHRYFVDIDTGYLRDDLGVDGVHLKKTGYDAFFEILLPILENNN